MRFLALALAVLALAIGEARGADLRLTLRGLERSKPRARPLRWLSINLEVDNRGKETLRGRFKVFRTRGGKSALPRQNLSYERPAALPPGRRRVALRYFVQGDEGPDELAVTFVPDDAEQEPPPPLFPDYQMTAESGIALTLAEDGAGARALAGCGVETPWGRRPYAVVEGAIEALPGEAIGYDAYDAILLLAAQNRAWDRSRVAALTAWVEAGGWLIVGPAVGSPGFTGSPLRTLLPVASGGEPSRGSLRALGQVVGARGPPGSSAVLALKPKPGATSLAVDEAGRPLIITAPHGLGRVTVLAFAPRDAILEGWPGRRSLMERLLPPQAPRLDPLGVGPPPLDEYLLNLSTRLESLRPPSVVLLGPVLLVYAVMVGPLSLAWARRRDTPWLFYAAALGLSLAASAFVLGTVAAGKGAGAQSRGALLRLPCGDPEASPSTGATAEMVTGLMTGSGAALSAEPGRGGALAPVLREGTPLSARFIDRGDGGTALERSQMSAWSFRRLRERRPAPLGDIAARLSLDRARITGRIINRSPGAITAAAAIIAGQAFAIGPLAAGEERELAVGLRPARGDDEPLEAVLDALLDDLPGYEAYYTAEIFETVPARARLLASLRAEARRQAGAPGELRALLIGVWEGEIDEEEARFGLPIAASRTLVLCAVPLDCPRGRLRLSDLPATAALLDGALVSGESELSYAIQAQDASGSGPGRARFVFQVPLSPGTRFRAERLVVEARLELPAADRLELRLFDGSRGALGERIDHDGVKVRFQTVEGERFVDPRRGRVILEVRNPTGEVVILKGLRARVVGQAELDGD